MLDKIIHAHLDEMDKIEEDVQKDIDEIISQIDIDEIMNNPLAELTVVIEAVKAVLENEYIPKAITEGKKLSQDIAKSPKDIVVPDTKNPNLNEDLVDDKSGSEK